jgi:replicative DNA helicase
MSTESSTWDDPESLFTDDPERAAKLAALAGILAGAGGRDWPPTRDALAAFLRAEREAAGDPLTPATERLDAIAADVVKRHEQRQATGKDVMGHATGLARLDTLLGGLDRGRLSVLLAAPGGGKTTTSNQIAATIAAAGTPALYITFENTADDLILKQIARLAAKSAADIRRGRVAPAELAAAYGTFHDRAGRHLYYLSGGAGTTVETIRGAVEQLQRTYPDTYPLVVVDFLQRLATAADVVGRGAGLDDMRGRVGIIAQQLRGLANDTGCHIWAISSTNRQAYDTAKATPGLASARESGDIEFAADAVLTLAPDTKADAAGFTANTDPFVLTIVKNRHGDTGPIALMRERATLRMVEADPVPISQAGRARAGWSSAAS